MLDPFFGTGTTGAVARRLHRRWIGIEREADYAALARQRIAAIEPADDPTLVATPSRRNEPRIPFGWIVERGLLHPGTVLSDPTRRFTAKVRADGTVISAEHRGSIHQVGALVQGASACNGWTFWHFENGGEFRPIDLLRQQMRTQLS